MITLGRLVQLGPRAYAIESEPEAASNAGIVIGDDAILLVDTRLTPALGAELVATARTLGGDRRLYYANTHAHGDHCFGNGACAGALGIATTAARVALNRDWAAQVERFCELRPHQCAEFRAAEKTVPALAFDDRLTLDLGGVQVRLESVGPAHTAGDAIVRTEDVIYTGDLIYHGHWPVLSPDGDLGRWLAALDRLDAPTLVPGHGPIGGPEIARRMRDCWAYLAARARGEDPDGSAFEGWLHPQRIAAAIPALSKLQGAL